MDEADRKELDRVAQTAAKAIRMTEKTAADILAHEEICLLIRQGQEEHQKRNEKFQDEILGKVEDGLKLVRESFQIALTEQAERLDRQGSDFNLRLSASIKTTVEAITAQVTMIKEQAMLTIKTVSDAQVAFFTMQAQANKDLNAANVENGRRIWALTYSVGGGVIAILMAAFAASFTKNLHWW